MKGSTSLLDIRTYCYGKVLVNSFNNDNTPVFLISLKAGGTGQELVDAILSGENGSITQMSKEELMELLEG